MASSPKVWPIDGVNVAVLADCHIHPGGGPAFPPALFDALVGSDLIVTLGDMGEAAALDRLAEIAPVIGVRGADDSDDPRTNAQVLVLTSDDLVLGCIFDATKAGLATSSDPFRPAADFDAVAERVFGRKVDLLLHASTHRGEASNAGDCLVFNPGSAVLPAEGGSATFLELNLDDGRLEGRLVPLN